VSWAHELHSLCWLVGRKLWVRFPLGVCKRCCVALCDLTHVFFYLVLITRATKTVGRNERLGVTTAAQQLSGITIDWHLQGCFMSCKPVRKRDIDGEGDIDQTNDNDESEANVL